MQVNSSNNQDATEATNNTRNTNDCSYVTTPEPEAVEFEAFVYIVVVIAFYATSIVFLLIKYARNDDEEQSLKYNYTEFVKREKFQTAQYKNMEALVRTKTVLDHYLYPETQHNNHCNALDGKCPVIIVSEYSDAGIHTKEIDLDKSIEERGDICDNINNCDTESKEKYDVITEKQDGVVEKATRTEDTKSVSSAVSLLPDGWVPGKWRSRCQTL